MKKRAEMKTDANAYALATNFVAVPDALLDDLEAHFEELDREDLLRLASVYFIFWHFVAEEELVLSIGGVATFIPDGANMLAHFHLNKNNATTLHVFKHCSAWIMSHKDEVKRIMETAHEKFKELPKEFTSTCGKTGHA